MGAIDDMINGVLDDMAWTVAASTGVRNATRLKAEAIENVTASLVAATNVAQEMTADQVANLQERLVNLGAGAYDADMYQRYRADRDPDVAVTDPGVGTSTVYTRLDGLMGTYMREGEALDSSVRALYGYRADAFYELVSELLLILTYDDVTDAVAITARCDDEYHSTDAPKFVYG